MLDGGQRLVDGVGDGGPGVLEADAVHRLAEELAVLGLLDGLALGADQLDAELREHAHVVERERGVEAGLAAHRRQQRVGAFLLDDPGDDLGGDRLDVGGVGHLRVGHDRRGVGVDEDDAVALLAQRLAGLGAGIVELASLADDDRPRTDDQDRADVGAFGHVRPCRIVARRQGRRGRCTRQRSANWRGYSGGGRERKPVPAEPPAALGVGAIGRVARGPVASDRGDELWRPSRRSTKSATRSPWSQRPVAESRPRG